MGNNQNKLSKEMSPSSVVNNPSGSLPSGLLPTEIKLDSAFTKLVSAHGAEKTTLTKQDFVVHVFATIPDVGKFVYKYLSLLQSADNSKLPINKTIYVKGGTQILSLLSDGDQLDFYVRLFAKGKDIICSSAVIALLTMSQRAAWLSAGMNLPITEGSRQHLEAVIKNLLKGDLSVSISDVCSWSCKLCPKLTTNLHSYVCSCLLGNRESFLKKEGISNEIVTKCGDGHSLVSLSSMWLLTCLLPRTYYPIMISSSLMPLSDIANIVQNNAWHLLYDSNSQGLSVNRFQHHIMDYTGPTLLFFSFNQYKYALAVDVQWKESSQRWGGDDGMYFELQPDYKLIQSGVGLMYLNLSDRSAPKGLHIGRDARTTFLKINDELSKVNHYSVDYKLDAIEVWGCGGQECLASLHRQKQWESKEVTKNQNRKLVPDDWKDSPDRLILELGGVTTEHNQRVDI